MHSIAILCEFGSVNGGEHSILTLLPLLRQRGLQFHVLAPPEGSLAEMVRKLNFNLVPFNAQTGEPLEQRRKRLGRILAELGPLLLHANSVAMARLSGPVVEKLHLPSIAHLRDIIHLNATYIADINKHHRILAVSEATCSFHIKQGLDGNRCHVLYNGVDLEKFSFGSPTGYLHRELGIPPSAPLLAVIGQIGLRKGQDDLLEWLTPVFTRRSEPHLLVVGSRWSEKEESVRFEENLRHISLHTPFTGRVHFLGVRNDVDRLMRELTILLHPAKQEPLGRVLLEAAACAIPVIATNVGGTSEIFPNSLVRPIRDATGARGEGREVRDMGRGMRSEETGNTTMVQVDNTASAMVVEAPLSISFPVAVKTLLDSAELRKRLGTNARKQAETCFSKEAAAEALYQHYRNEFS